MHNYCYFGRAETGVRCHMDDIAVDMPGGYIMLFVRKANGDHRQAATTAADCCKTAISGPRGGVYRWTHHLMLPARQWARAHNLLGHFTRRDTARVDCKDHHLVDSRGVHRHWRFTPSPPRNSNGHRIAYGKARRPPLHASAHPSPRFTIWEVHRKLATSPLASTSTLPSA
jgi:hypothetical protein